MLKFQALELEARALNPISHSGTLALSVAGMRAPHPPPCASASRAAPVILGETVLGVLEALPHAFRGE